jgi:ribulose-5-phosphate 4-epimerase/fuculose-1-phosphate aldolase
MSGHISVRDPEFEDYIWMNPLGKHFGLMTAGDMICLNLNTGAIVGGNKVRISSFLLTHLWGRHCRNIAPCDLA